MVVEQSAEDVGCERCGRGDMNGEGGFKRIGESRAILKSSELVNNLWREQTGA